MHAISSYRGNRLTNKHTNAATNPQTHRQDRLQYTALQLVRSVITAHEKQIRNGCCNMDGDRCQRRVNNLPKVVKYWNYFHSQKVIHTNFFLKSNKTTKRQMSDICLTSVSQRILQKPEQPGPAHCHQFCSSSLLPVGLRGRGRRQC